MRQVIGNMAGRVVRAAVVLFASAILLFVAIGRADLFNPDEPREAEMVREMWASGDCLVPRLNGEPFLEKPPLFYWLVVAAYRVAGGPGEGAARLVPAIAGTLSVLLLLLFGRDLVGERGALLAAFVLLTSFQFFWIARRCMIDMPLLLMVLLACFAFHRGFVLPGGFRPAWQALGFAATAAAVLLKGIVGAGIPALALGGYLVTQRDWKTLWRRLLPGMSLAFAPVVAWTVLLHGRLGGAATREFVWVNNVLRFTGGASKGHDKPFHYYAPTFLVEFAPWSLLLPFVLVAACLAARRTDGVPAGATETRPAPRSIVYLLCWLVLPMIVLSIASTKRGIYLLPVYPAAALLVGWWLDRLDGQRASGAGVGERDPPAAWAARAGQALLYAAAILMSSVFLALLTAARPTDWITTTIALAIVLLPGLAAFHALRSRLAGRLALLIALMVGLLELGASLLIVPRIVNRGVSVRQEARTLVRLVEQGDRLAFYRFHQGMLGGYLFYAGRTFPNLGTLEQLKDYLMTDAGLPDGSRSLVLMREDVYQEVAPKLAVKTTIASRFESALQGIGPTRRWPILLIAPEDAGRGGTARRDQP
jgi:4-amino-4-deoxy-L-arabinose transferase-like glycosyltransferase